MGAIMLTGIMAIFEMGLSLTGQTLLSTPSDVYFDLQTPRPKELDQEILILLATPGNVGRDLIGNNLCDALNNAGSGEYAFELIGGEGVWADGCQFNTDFGTISHRIRIRPPAESSLLPYEFFSCTSASADDQCSFEWKEEGL